MKKPILLLLITMLLFQPLAANAIMVQVDGTPLQMDVAPVSMEGRTMVPLRSIFDALGSQTQWNPDEQSITATTEEVTINLRIGSDQSTVNGQPVVVEVPPTIVDGRTLVPTRFVAESLGATVDWLPESQTVAIVSKENNTDKHLESQSSTDNNVIPPQSESTKTPVGITENPREELVVYYAEDNYARFKLEYPHIHLEGRVPKDFDREWLSVTMGGLPTYQRVAIDASGRFEETFSIDEKKDMCPYAYETVPTLRDWLTGRSFWPATDEMRFSVGVRLPHISEERGKDTSFSTGLSEEDQELFFDIDMENYERNLRRLHPPTEEDMQIVHGRDDPRYYKLEQIVNKATDPEMSDYEKAFALAVWVAENIHYPNNVEGITRRRDIQLYDILDRRWGVCGAYTRVYESLLRAAGIPARGRSGLVNNDPTRAGHAWSSFYVDGRWVFVDTTWMSRNQYFGDVDVYTDGDINLDEFDIHIIELSEDRG